MAYYLFCFSPTLLSLPLRSVAWSGRWHWPRLARPVEDLASASFPPLTFSLPSLCVVINWRGHIQDEKQVSQEKCESLYAFSWYQHQLPLSPNSPPYHPPSSHSLTLPLLYPFSIVYLAQRLLSPSLPRSLLPSFSHSLALLSVYSWTA